MCSNHTTPTEQALESLDSGVLAFKVGKKAGSRKPGASVWYQAVSADAGEQHAAGVLRGAEIGREGGDRMPEDVLL